MGRRVYLASLKIYLTSGAARIRFLLMPHKHRGFADFVQELDSRPGHNSTLICPKGETDL